ncbi:hypothetical protein [Variovorax saccharolyticus]|uniref:hypothetical protein n=1 Tax=Variovorax saccharolyticus TaxID=3053516 RepID=UPI00257637A5|nr:hypothetical protein [Variovorax sp. J22R187]MDM0022168.1 hypothetical protein [Variovorax sp. J22R187]
MNKALLFAALATVAVRAMADYSYADENAANRAPTVLIASRATVEAELVRATTSGDLYGLHGSPFKRLSPSFYPADPPVYSKTLAQARADLAQAMRNGDMLAANETGLTMNQLSPKAYASARQMSVRVLASATSDVGESPQVGD